MAKNPSTTLNMETSDKKIQCVKKKGGTLIILACMAVYNRVICRLPFLVFTNHPVRFQSYLAKERINFYAPKKMRYVITISIGRRSSFHRPKKMTTVDGFKTRLKKLYIRVIFKNSIWVHSLPVKDIDLLASIPSNTISSPSVQVFDNGLLYHLDPISKR